MHNNIKPVTQWYLEHINYGSLCLLMAIENSLIPFPSEIVVPPATWKAARRELNLALVLLRYYHVISLALLSALGLVLSHTSS